MCCFFQAEDGIRDLTVTGVQTCALPICLFDQTIQEIESGTVDKQGNLTLMLRGDSSAFMVARMNPEPYILFYEGDQIPVELPVNAFTFIGGARTGPPHVQAGGKPGSTSALSSS